MVWFGKGKSGSSVFSSSSSSRRALPRPGYIKRVIRYIKRLFRSIYKYARHHPYKVFILVIVPLITSGVLQKLFAMIGLRLPNNLLGNLPPMPGVPANLLNAAGAAQAQSISGGLRQSVIGLMALAKTLM